MRIGIDCRSVDADGAGVGQYGHNLATVLGSVDRENEYVMIRPAGRRLPFITAHLGMRLAYESAHADLIHVPGGAAPLGYRGRYVLTVHDLAIYRHPEWFPGGQWFSTRISYPSSIRNAAHLIVPSQTTKQDLVELFNVPDGQISMIPHGVRHSPKNNGRYNLASRYILFLGTIEPRKNIPLLIRAYRRLVDEAPALREVELRIAGAIGWRADDILSEIDRARSAGYRIAMLGRVTEDEKWRLLAGASCFVFPPFYEGFGMPVLEAMAAGAPVVCSDIPTHREVAGEAALYFDRYTFDSAAPKVKQVLTDEKTADELREKGRARAAQFSWEKCARATIEVYKRIRR